MPNDMQFQREVNAELRIEQAIRKCIHIVQEEVDSDVCCGNYECGADTGFTCCGKYLMRRKTAEEIEIELQSLLRQV